MVLLEVGGSWCVPSLEPVACFGQLQAQESKLCLRVSLAVLSIVHLSKEGTFHLEVCSDAFE